MNVHQQLEDAKTLSDVSGPLVFSTKADTLSISEVGEKVRIILISNPGADNNPG
jgi:hypothetical protein